MLVLVKISSILRVELNSKDYDIIPIVYGSLWTNFRRQIIVIYFK